MRRKMEGDFGTRQVRPLGLVVAGRRSEVTPYDPELAFRAHGARRCPNRDHDLRRSPRLVRRPGQSGEGVGRGRRGTRRRSGAECFVIDREMPKDVPLAVRRKLYACILERASASSARYERGILSYEVNVKIVADRVDRDLARYRDAMRLIVVDDAIQSGAATFRGTRILVHQIAGLLAQGVEIPELQQDYPRLTPEMIAAAPIYARAHPRRGRPRKPTWRAGDASNYEGPQHGA